MPWQGKATAKFPDGEVSIDPHHYGVIDVRRVSHVRWASDCEILVLRVTLSRLKSYAESLLGVRPRKDQPRPRVGIFLPDRCWDELPAGLKVPPCDGDSVTSETFAAPYRRRYGEMPSQTPYLIPR